MTEFLREAPQNLTTNDVMGCVGFLKEAFAKITSVAPNKATPHDDDFWKNSIKGIKQDEIKKQMIKTFKENNPAEYQDIDWEDLKRPLLGDDL